MLFSVGQIVITPGAKQAFEECGAYPLDYLMKHVDGDWGSLCAEDKKANEQALKDGTRILSAYILPDNATRIWIITEADRSSTCILLPEEY